VIEEGTNGRDRDRTDDLYRVKVTLLVLPKITGRPLKSRTDTGFRPAAYTFFRNRTECKKLAENLGFVFAFVHGRSEIVS